MDENSRHPNYYCIFGINLEWVFSGLSPEKILSWTELARFITAFHVERMLRNVVSPPHVLSGSGCCPDHPTRKGPFREYIAPSVNALKLGCFLSAKGFNLT